MVTPPHVLLHYHSHRTPLAHLLHSPNTTHTTRSSDKHLLPVPFMHTTSKRRFFAVGVLSIGNYLPASLCFALSSSTFCTVLKTLLLPAILLPWQPCNRLCFLPGPYPNWPASRHVGPSTPLLTCVKVIIDMCLMSFCVPYWQDRQEQQY